MLSWAKTLPPSLEAQLKNINKMIELYVQPVLAQLREGCHEVIATNDSQLVVGAITM